MKRILRLGLLLAVLLPTLVFSAGADELLEEQKQSVDVSALEEAAPDQLEGVDALGLTGLDGLGDRLLSGVRDQLRDILQSTAKSGGALLLIVLLCSVAEVFEGFGDGLSRQAVRLAGATGVAMVALSDVSGMMGLGKETVDQLSDFTTILMPTMTTAAVAGGAAVSAPVRQAATLLCSNLLTKLVTTLLMPLTWAYAAGSVGCCAMDDQRLRPLCQLLRWLVMTTLTTTLIVYTGYLSVAGAVTSGTDATTIKVAQMTISGMIPVVGGILSDATEAVLSGASILRNSIGLFGMVGVLGFCLVPFLRLGVQYLLYKLVAVLAAAMTDHPVSKLIQDLGSVFSMVMGMTGACALVVLLSVMSVISAVVGI